MGVKLLAFDKNGGGIQQSKNKQQKNPSSLLFPLHKALNNTLNLPVCMLYVGPPQQYPGQEDYYGDQYSHAGQGASEGRRSLQSLGEDVDWTDKEQARISNFFIILWRSLFEYGALNMKR